MEGLMLVQSIKRRIKEKGLTISQVEKDLNMSIGLISRWERTSPSLNKLIELSKYLNVTLHQLIGFDEKSIENHEEKDDDIIIKILKKTNDDELKWEPLSEKEAFNKKIIELFSNESSNNKYYFCRKDDGFFLLIVFLSPINHDENVSVKLYSLFQNYAEPNEIITKNNFDKSNIIDILRIIDYNIYIQWNKEGAKIFENRIDD